MSRDAAVPVSLGRADLRRGSDLSSGPPASQRSTLPWVYQSPSTMRVQGRPSTWKG